MPEHPSPFPPLRDAQEAHDYLTRVAMFAAKYSAREMAKLTGRMGLSHQHLIAGHVLYLMDGMGDDATFDWLEQLIRDLSDPPNGGQTAKSVRESRKNK